MRGAHGGGNRAVEGLGIALGRTRFVEADIAAGRLVVPFDIVLPANPPLSERAA